MPQCPVYNATFKTGNNINKQMLNLSQIKKRPGKSIPYTSLGTYKNFVFKKMFTLIMVKKPLNSAYHISKMHLYTETMWK